MLNEIKQLCDLYGIKPARSKGQNFLISEKIYQNVAEAADLTKDDTVLEVGPGLGFLTLELAKRVKKVIAVELDKKLCDALKARLEIENVKNVEIVQDDILKVQNPKSKAQNKSQITNLKIPSAYKVVANLPYNITSIFLRKYLSEVENKPELMVLMLQKEVAERITALPGAMSLLAVSVQYYSQPEIVARVPRQDFWPEPEVDSAIVRIKVKRESIQYTVDRGEKEFFRLAKIGFSAKRKMLKNNLANGYKVEQAKVGQWLEQAGINDKARAQDLSLEDWRKLLKIM